MLFSTTNIEKIYGPVTFLLFELQCYLKKKIMWIQVVVYNSKAFIEIMTQPFLKILKGTFY